MSIKNVKSIKGTLRINELAKGVVAFALLFTSIDIHIDGDGVSISVSIARRGGKESGKEPD